MAEEKRRELSDAEKKLYEKQLKALPEIVEELEYQIDNRVRRLKKGLSIEFRMLARAIEAEANKFNDDLLIAKKNIEVANEHMTKGVIIKEVKDDE